MVAKEKGADDSGLQLRVTVLHQLYVFGAEKDFLGNTRTDMQAAGGQAVIVYE